MAKIDFKKHQKNAKILHEMINQDIITLEMARRTVDDGNGYEAICSALNLLKQTAIFLTDNTSVLEGAKIMYQQEHERMISLRKE